MSRDHAANRSLTSRQRGRIIDRAAATATTDREADMTTEGKPGITEAEVRQGWTMADEVQAWQAAEAAAPLDATQFREALDANLAAIASRDMYAAMQRHPSGRNLHRTPFAGGRVSRVVDLGILGALIIGAWACVFVVGSAVWFLVSAAWSAM